MNQIAVTGAAGFIGSALIWRLNQLGYDRILAVDALDEDQRYANLVNLDFCDFMAQSDFLARSQNGNLPHLRAVFHLGACSATTERDAGFLMRNNYEYTRTLAEACLRRGVRLVYASSAATYGDGSAGYQDGSATLTSLRPLNKYAFSKHAFDVWALRHGALDSIAGLKYFNVFGPNEYHKAGMRSMVLQAYEQIETHGAVKLFRSERPDFADGAQERDFIYVKDAAAMTAWFLDHPEATGIFNIGAGRARTWNDLARAVFAALDRPPRLEYVPLPQAIRAAYQYSTCASLERLRAAGCALAAQPLETAVVDYVRNYLSATNRYLA